MRNRLACRFSLTILFAVGACGGDGGSGAPSAAGSGEVATACLIESNGEPASCSETLNDDLGTADQRAQLIDTMRGICANAFSSADYSFQVVSACPVSDSLVGYCERTIPAQPYLRTSRAYTYVGSEGADEQLARDSFECLTSGGKYVKSDGDEVVPPSEPLSDVAGITAGASHVCAWTNAGKVYCWGRNDQGQIGNAESIDAPVPTPTKVDGLTSVVSLAARGDHTCALHDDGTVSCWGENPNKVVDGKSSEPQLAPAKVEGVSGAISLATSDTESCTLSDEGQITCWGLRYGSPTELRGLDGVKAISAASGLCVLFDDDTVECNLLCTQESPGVATCTRQDADFTQASLHGSNGIDSCVVTTEQAVVCGNGDAQKAVADVSGATALSFGDVFDCALLDSGAVDCWPGFAGNLVPYVPKGVTEIMSGGATAVAGNCALLDDSTVSCWGLNSDGERGSYWPAQLMTTTPDVSETSLVVR